MLAKQLRPALHSPAVGARALSTMGLTRNRKYFPDLVRRELERNNNKQTSRQFGSTMTPLVMWDGFIASSVRFYAATRRTAPCVRVLDSSSLI